VLQEAMKPAQQFQDVMKQWRESQRALREAVAPSQKYLDAIANAKKIAAMSGEADEE
jgi:response regulator of citrate/malate metabolism